MFKAEDLFSESCIWVIQFYSLASLLKSTLYIPRDRLRRWKNDEEKCPKINRKRIVCQIATKRRQFFGIQYIIICCVMSGDRKKKAYLFIEWQGKTFQNFPQLPVFCTFFFAYDNEDWVVKSVAEIWLRGKRVG